MTLYAFRPAESDNEPEAELDVVDELKGGWDCLDQAVDLWQLVDVNQAAALRAVMNRAVQAGQDGEPRFERADIEAAVHLLTGLEEALVAAGVVDVHWAVPIEQVGELSQRVYGMDVRPERTPRELTQSLAEVIVNPISVRIFLADALVKGFAVVLA